MRKLIAFEFLSVDGFMAGPPGKEMEFVVSNFSAQMEENLAAQYQQVDAFIMGRVTFESLAHYWPTAAAQDERLQRPMNEMQKLVCSKTMEQLPWANSRLLRPDAVEEIRRIRSLPGKSMMIIGSASVVQELVRHQLIDEFRFFIFPSVVGTGKRLFDRQAAIHMKLLRSERFDTGVCRADYAPAYGNQVIIPMDQSNADEPR